MSNRNDLLFSGNENPSPQHYKNDYKDLARISPVAIFTHQDCFQSSEKRFKDESTPGPGPAGYSVHRTAVEKERERKDKARAASFVSATERKLALNSKQRREHADLRVQFRMPQGWARTTCRVTRGSPLTAVCCTGALQTTLL